MDAPFIIVFLYFDLHFILLGLNYTIFFCKSNKNVRGQLNMTDAEKQYENVCKDRFDKQEQNDTKLFAKLDKLQASMDEGFADLDKRLYRDNGNRSIVNRVGDNEKLIESLAEELKKNPWIRATKWLVITTSGLLLSGIIGTVFYFVRSWLF